MGEPGQIESEDPQVTCPKCGAGMDREGVEGVAIDRCPGCGGLWLDALEREKLVVTASAVRATDSGASGQHDERDAQQHVKCPRDHSDMIHVVDPEQPHVGFESCTVCGGIYLDAGELRDLAQLTLFERIRSYLGAM